MRHWQVENGPKIYAPMFEIKLDFLQDQNIPMSIASNGLGKGYGDEVLEMFKLDKYFKTHVFREHIKKSKPHPEPILLSIKRLQEAIGRRINSEDIIWYIGDRRKDISASLAANELVEAQIIPIACAFNAGLAMLEKRQNPEQIILSFYDLHERLKALFS